MIDWVIAAVVDRKSLVVLSVLLLLVVLLVLLLAGEVHWEVAARYC